MVGSGSQNGLNLLSPIVIKFATDTPAGASAFAVGVAPGVEYDIPLALKSAYISPSFSLSFEYWNTKATILGASLSVDSFVLGIIPAVSLKYIIKDHVLLRFQPMGLEISPYQYVEGLGSETGLTIAYDLYGGVSYLF